MNALSRWRLVLGRFAQDRLDTPLSAHEARMEAALDFLYSRAYAGRGVRGHERGSSLDESQLNVPTWLGEVRELFPRDVVEVIEQHALERYGLVELLTDRETLEGLEPNMQLLKTLLTFRGHLHGDVLDTARRIIRTVVDELTRTLEAEVRRALAGRVSRFRHSPHKAARDFDWRGTIQRNLQHYSPERKQLLVRETRFFQRNTRTLPWTVVLCVDQSGSMADSVIHSAVMAGILAALPLIGVKLVLFDTAIVDVSAHVSDPVEVLLSAQLGGGTNIGQALAYCETLVDNPHRTVIALVSDFCEGASPAVLLGTCRRLAESGVKLIGLAALDQSATPAYDHRMARDLVDAGMEIAALTPKHFADWLAKVMQSR